MDASEQIFQISKVLDTLSFVVILRMFLRNLTKIGRIYIPYKLAQSGCIPPKIKCEILAHKGSSRQEIISLDQDFLGKVTHADTVIVLSRSLKER